MKLVSKQTQLKIKVNTGNLEALIRKVEKFRSSIIPIASGILVKQIQVLSRDQQKSYTGEAFKPLTKPYARHKVKAGKQRVPNFVWSGKYINKGFGLHVDKKIPYIGPNEGFEGQAEGLNSKREHYGVHPDSIRNTERALADALEGIVK